MQTEDEMRTELLKLSTLARIEDTMKRCLKSEFATERQKHDARQALEACETVRRTCVGDEYAYNPIAAAIEVGRHLERVRHGVLRGPAGSGETRGTHFLGVWFEASALLIRLANYLSYSIGPDGADIHGLVLAVWGERYHTENRSKYRKALSQLSTAFLENDPPINAAITVSGDRVMIETFTP